MIYFAHRGASAQAVQNTVRAFERARQLGATCYELDVHLTQDGVLAVHHDYSLLSTTGHDVQIASSSFAALQSYPLKNAFGAERLFVPRLEDILPLVTPGLDYLNIELKNDGNRYPGVEEKLLSLLQNKFPRLFSKTLFSSFDYETLVRLRALDGSARIGLLTRSFDVSAAINLRAESVHLNFARFTPQIAQVCHDNGLKVYLYTVNDVPLAARLAAQGADGIFTDDIGKFLR